VSAVGLETGSGQAGLFSRRAGLGHACISLHCTGLGRAESFRAGLGLIFSARAWLYCAYSWHFSIDGHHAYRKLPVNSKSNSYLSLSSLHKAVSGMFELNCVFTDNY